MVGRDNIFILFYFFLYIIHTFSFSRFFLSRNVPFFFFSCSGSGSSSDTNCPTSFILPSDILPACCKGENIIHAEYGVWQGGWQWGCVWWEGGRGSSSDTNCPTSFILPSDILPACCKRERKNIRWVLAWYQGWGARDTAGGGEGVKKVMTGVCGTRAGARVLIKIVQPRLFYRGTSYPPAVRKKYTLSAGMIGGGGKRSWQEGVALGRGSSSDTNCPTSFILPSDIFPACCKEKKKYAECLHDTGGRGGQKVITWGCGTGAGDQLSSDTNCPTSFILPSDILPACCKKKERI